jgi:DNA-binding response OmpR family regulator
MRLALLEDDLDQSAALQRWLDEAGYSVHAYARARDLMRDAGRESFDLFLLDWMVPDQSGEQVLVWLREQRTSDAPVIFVTSRDAEEDVAAVLRAGADDYMVKPIRRLELLSRIEAVLRRARPAVAEASELEAPPYRFDFPSHQVFVDGELAQLTEKEFELAAFFFRNMGRLLSRGHLLEAVWGKSSAVATRTIDTHISRVRTKLGLRPQNGYRLAPVYNFGYRLERIASAEEDRG